MKTEKSANAWQMQPLLNYTNHWPFTLFIKFNMLVAVLSLFCCRVGILPFCIILFKLYVAIFFQKSSMDKDLRNTFKAIYLFNSYIYLVYSVLWYRWTYYLIRFPCLVSTLLLLKLSYDTIIWYNHSVSTHWSSNCSRPWLFWNPSFDTLIL